MTGLPWRDQAGAASEATAPVVAKWTHARLFETLVTAGVAAGPVQDDADYFRGRHPRARGWFRSLTRDAFGTFEHPGSLFRWTGPSSLFRRASVRLGEGNEYVHRALLGHNVLVGLDHHRPFAARYLHRHDLAVEAPRDNRRRAALGLGGKGILIQARDLELIGQVVDRHARVAVDKRALATVEDHPIQEVPLPIR